MGILNSLKRLFQGKGRRRQIVPSQDPFSGRYYISGGVNSNSDEEETEQDNITPFIAGMAMQSALNDVLTGSGASIEYVPDPDPAPSFSGMGGGTFGGGGAEGTWDNNSDTGSSDSNDFNQSSDNSSDSDSDNSSSDDSSSDSSSDGSDSN